MVYYSYGTVSSIGVGVRESAALRICANRFSLVRMRCGCNTPLLFNCSASGAATASSSSSTLSPSASVNLSAIAASASLSAAVCDQPIRYPCTLAMPLPVGYAVGRLLGWAILARAEVLRALAERPSVLHHRIRPTHARRCLPEGTSHPIVCSH